MRDRGVLPVPIPFENYYLLEKIATGGMAEVFKAKAFGVEGFERLLAVKRILASISEDPDFKAMFIDEANITNHLNHANIAQIFELGSADGSYFIAMEYVSGRDARAIFERFRRDGRKLGVDMACYIAMKVCEGLDYAHAKTDSSGKPLNIVHRDVSPQNILVSYEGEVKLIDFGIAKAAGKSAQTQVGILKGKFSYMSPEQVRGLSLDRRSDVFSLAICLYELLTCERLFLGESDFETLEKIRKVEVAPPSLFNPEIPQALEDIVLKGLTRDPNARYQHAGELQEALRKFLFDQSLHFTNKNLAATMQSVFDEELHLERQKLEYFQTLDLQTIKVQSGESASRAAVKRGTGSALSWDPDEVPTTVWDHPDSDAELEAVLADFDEELDEDDWEEADDTRPRSPRTGGSPPPPPPPVPGSSSASYRASFPERGAPAGERPKRADDEWERIATTGSQPPVAPAATNKTTGELEPEPAPAQRPTGIYVPPRRRSNAPIVAGLLVLALLLGAGAVFLLSTLGGQVTLEFTPQPSNVRVLLDDRIVHSGPTPAVYRDIEPGTYDLTLWAEGYESMTQEVTLEEGGSYTINWSLVEVSAAPAPITVSSNPPGASIFVDGADTGEITPAVLRDLGRGAHQVRVAMAGRIAHTETVVVGDEAASLAPNLAAERFDLVIQPTPEGASYWLSTPGSDQEVAAGQGAATIPGLDGSRSYVLLVNAEGHRPSSQLIEPGVDAVRTVQVALNPLGGSAEVAAPEVPVAAAEEEPEREERDRGREREDEDEDERAARQAREAEREIERQERRERERLAAAERAAAEERGDESGGEGGNTATSDSEPGEGEGGGEEFVAANSGERVETEPAGEQVEEPAGPGQLSVQSRPSAEVFINGRSYGYTPLVRQELPAGRYTVRLVAPQFDLDHSETVNVPAGGTETVTYRHQN
jgi:serine/threonine protein kinase